MVQEQGAGVAQARVRRIARPLVRRLWDIDAKGFERLPVEGPAILCPNHISFIDSVFLMLLAPRNVTSVGKAEYMDSWKTRYLFPALGMIPLDRTGGRKSMAALETAAGALRRGDLFLIYPEGTRSRDGKLHKGRTGAARLALETGAPIYPVGIRGTDRIQPPDASVPALFKRASVEVGRPIRPERYAAWPERHRALRAMIDEVMYEIRELSGQDYVNTYAGTAEDATAELRKKAAPAHVRGSLPGDVDAAEGDAELNLAGASV